jgi:hypothetical protein
MPNSARNIEFAGSEGRYAQKDMVSGHVSLVHALRQALRVSKFVE